MMGANCSCENNNKVSVNTNQFLPNLRISWTNNLHFCWVCLHVLLPDWTFWRLPAENDSNDQVSKSS